MAVFRPVSTGVIGGHSDSKKTLRFLPLLPRLDGHALAEGGVVVEGAAAEEEVYARREVVGVVGGAELGVELDQRRIIPGRFIGDDDVGGVGGPGFVEVVRPPVFSSGGVFA